MGMLKVTCKTESKIPSIVSMLSIRSSRMTIQAKILGGFMTVILLVAVMSGFTYWKIGQLNSYSQETARQNLTKIELAEELALDVANETLSLHRFNSSGNLADVADFFNFRKYGDDKLTKLENALSSGTARGILDSVKEEKTDFDTLAEKFITARRADELEQAGAYMKEAYKPAESVVAKTKDLTLAVKESVRDEEENSTKTPGRCKSS